MWIAFAGFVGFELWPWIPHTPLGVAGVLVLGPPLWLLAESVAGRALASLPVRAIGEPPSRAIRIFDRVLVLGVLMLAATIAIFVRLGHGG